MKRALLLTSLYICLSLTGAAQHIYTVKAFDLFDSQMFAQAIPALQKAWSVEKNSSFQSEIVFRLGECFRENAEYENALIQYERAEKLNDDPKYTYNKALMLKAIGRYPQAREALTLYLEINPGSVEARTALDGVKLAEDFAGRKSDYIVRNMTDLNCEERDFSPVYAGRKGSTGTLIFTSTRSAVSKAMSDYRSGGSASSLYTAVMEKKSEQSPGGKTKWTTPTLLKGFTGTRNHEGAACLNNERNTMYFTRCEYLDEDNMGCSIYVSTLDAKGWSEPKVAVQLDSGYVVGHPAISPDGKKLYFASDKGKRNRKDLFYSEIKPDGTYGEPLSLGKNINTEGNEIYPFIDGRGTLYFASDSHPGMGGMDLFRSELKNGVYQRPVNLGAPFNSSSDDFTIVADEDFTQGYFSSNRPGGVGKDDIYEFRKMPYLYQIRGKIIDNKSGVPLPEVLVRIEGNDGSIATADSDNRGEFLFAPALVKGNTTYKVSLEKKRYLIKTISVTTIGIGEEEFARTPDGHLSTVTANTELDPISIPIVLPRIEYDFNSASLRPEGKASLDELAEVLEENPLIVIELRSHTDHIGSDKYNEELSQKRAESCVNYLITKGIDPIRLHAKGMGENEPFTIAVNFESSFAPGTILTESFIASTATPAQDEEARQYNRRTDFKVLGELTRANIYMANTITTADPALAAAIEQPVTGESTTRSQNNIPAQQGKQNASQEIIDMSLAPEAFVLDTTVVEQSKLDKITEEQKSEDKLAMFYTLKAGENFGMVTSMFNITIEQLRTLNGGLRAIIPFEGMILKVNPAADYTEFDRMNYRLARTDNTPEKILESTGLSREEFTRLNPDFKAENIRPGDFIIRAD